MAEVLRLEAPATPATGASRSPPMMVGEVVEHLLTAAQALGGPGAGSSLENERATMGRGRRRTRGSCREACSFSRRCGRSLGGGGGDGGGGPRDAIVERLAHDGTRH